MMTTIIFSLLFLSTSLAVPKYLLLETEDGFNGEGEPGQDFKLGSSGGSCKEGIGKGRKAGEIWIDTRILPCGCACLEGKDHRGRLDVDCNCSTNEYEPKQKLLHMAEKLKLKYSKEKALAQLKRTQGPKATCVGDVDAGQITTKLRKAGEIWEESVFSCNTCGYRCKCDHGVKSCDCPDDYKDGCFQTDLPIAGKST